MAVSTSRWFLLTVILLGWGTVAQAQSTLEVDPDTLYYPAEGIVTAVNRSDLPVFLDSLAITFAGPRSWFFEVLVSDTVFVMNELGEAGPRGLELGAEIAGGDTARISFLSMDPCIVCATTAGRLDSADTLFVYSGGVTVPDTVVLDLSRFVASESDVPPRSTLHLETYPNPVHGSLTIIVRSDRSEEGSITLHDALGREIRHLGSGALEGRRVQANMQDLAPGLYFVRVGTVRAGVVTRAITVLP